MVRLKKLPLSAIHSNLRLEPVTGVIMQMEAAEEALLEANLKQPD
jgi:hypothetical protein